jgi:hypothetical protein
LVMAQRPSRLLGSPETRSLIFLIKNSPDQAEGYLDYLQPNHPATCTTQFNSTIKTGKPLTWFHPPERSFERIAPHCL